MSLRKTFQKLVVSNNYIACSGFYNSPLGEKKGVHCFATKETLWVKKPE